MQTTVHGIKNCDTVKKARAWLDSHAIEAQFRDFRETTPQQDEIESWFDHCDWQQVLNKRSTTWKNLDDAQRESVVDASSAAALMADHPTLIKRPILTTANATWVGFKPAQYASIFQQNQRISEHHV